MAITTSAGDGLRVISAAKNGTLPAQTGATTTQILFDTTIATNNGNLMVTPTFVGRLVIVRKEAATEETKYITAISANGLTGTVGEPWTTQPALSDTYHVSYIIEDAATLTGLSLISKRVNEYDCGRRFSVGLSGTFAYFALLDGASLQSNGNNSTTVADFTAETGSRWDIGYIAYGQPVSGGALYGTGNADGWLIFNGVAGSKFLAYDALLRDVRQSTHKFLGTAVFNRAKILFGLYTSDFTGLIQAYNTAFEGKSATTDTVKVDSSTDIESLNLVKSYGLTTANDSVVETVTVKNTNFVNNARFLTVYTNKSFNIVNPVWAVTTTNQADIFFNTAAGTIVREQFSLNATITTPEGTAIQSASVYVYEGTISGTMQASGTTSTSGTYSADLTKRVFTSGSSVLTVGTFGGFVLRTYKHGRTPFVGSLTVTVPIVQPVGLVTDPNVVQTTQAFAIASGSASIEVSRHATGETDPVPMKVLHYVSGSGTAPVYGQKVSGSTSAASGSVIEIIGDNAEGSIVLRNCREIDFTNVETIGNSSGWAAKADTTGSASSFYGKYTWLVDCSGNNLPVAYDYLAARMAEWPVVSYVTASFLKAHYWGKAEQSQLMYNGTTGYYTSRNVTDQKGVWVARKGTGTIAYLTSDSGSLFTPPVQYTFSLTGLQAGTEVRIYKTADDTELNGVESTSTTFSYNYVYSTDIPIYVVVFHTSYRDIRLTGLTLSNANQSIPIQQQFDRVYSNPA